MKKLFDIYEKMKDSPSTLVVHDHKHYGDIVYPVLGMIKIEGGVMVARTGWEEAGTQRIHLILGSFDLHSFMIDQKEFRIADSVHESMIIKELSSWIIAYYGSLSAKRQAFEDTEEALRRSI